MTRVSSIRVAPRLAQANYQGPTSGAHVARHIRRRRGQCLSRTAASKGYGSLPHSRASRNSQESTGPTFPERAQPVTVSTLSLCSSISSSEPTRYGLQMSTIDLRPYRTPSRLPRLARRTRFDPLTPLTFATFPLRRPCRLLSNIFSCPRRHRTLSTCQI